MYNCNRCLENRWSKEFIDGIIVLTCELCGNEVHISQKEKKDWKEGDLCKYCKEPVVLLELKITPKKLKNSYYYTHLLRCKKCKQNYYNIKYKINNEKHENT